MNIVQQFKYNNSNDYELIKRIRKLLLVEETGGPGENHRTVQVTDKFYHITGFELTTLVVIDTDCTDSCKSNYQTIITMTSFFIMEKNSE
jgi:hypothetical protein